MRRLSILLFLALALLAVTGCNAPKTQSLDVKLDISHDGPIGQEGMVKKGGVMLSMTKGKTLEVIDLKNRISGSFMGVSCDLPPQRFFNVEMDKTHYYAFSETSRAVSATGSGAGHGSLCGLKINKQNFMDTEVIMDTRDKACLGCGLNVLDIEDGDVPEIEKTTLLNTYDPAYLERQVKFENYADGYLTLYLLEKKAAQQGFDAQGKPISVPPVMTEQVLNFDLGESKTLNVAGCVIEVREATPDKLTYTVVKPMAEN